MTQACEYTNSKLVEVVTVADVDDEDRVGNNLLQILELRFGHKVIYFSREKNGIRDRGSTTLYTASKTVLDVVEI